MWIIYCVDDYLFHVYVLSTHVATRGSIHIYNNEQFIHVLASVGVDRGD